MFIYNEILLSHKKLYLVIKKKFPHLEEILTHNTAWMNLEDTILTEINQSQKYRYCVTSFTRAAAAAAAKSLQLCYQVYIKICRDRK